MTAKDNAQIRSDPNAFLAAYERARQHFITYDGVVGVGYGQKQTGDAYRDQIAIVVFVREKKPADRVPPSEQIPPTWEGYPTDVKIVRAASPLASCNNEAEYSELKGGIQICPKGQAQGGQALVAPGTLGCIVRKRNDSGRENTYLLSNKHVLFALGLSGVGDYAYHPYPPDPPGVSHGKPSNALGPIQAVSFFSNEAVSVPDPATAGQFVTIQMFLDAAIARIDLDSVCCGSTCTQDKTKYAASIDDLQVQHPGSTTKVNTIFDVRDVSHGPQSVAIISQKVIKVGRTTGRTVGIVRHINSPINVLAQPTLGTAAFTAEHMIEVDFDTSVAGGVNCVGKAWFADHGDSGSLVVDEQGRAIGLLAIGPAATAPPAAPCFVCHIVPILDRLNIAIACAGGTSHGSSLATDGSGVMPTAPTPAQSQLPAGQIVFTGAPTDTAPLGFPGVPTPMAVTDDDVRHMRGLLSAFEATPRGRELRQVFAEVRREVGYLVRNCRPVTVAWHRHKGPAFLAHVLNHVAGHTATIPHEIEGVTRRAMLVRMREVLSAHGSNPLRNALERHGDELMPILTDARCDTAADCIALVQERELV